MSDKPVAYFVGALNAFTTSQAEAEKESKKYPVEALYPAAAYEALQKENDTKTDRIAELEKEVKSLRKQKFGLLGARKAVRFEENPEPCKRG